MQDRSSRPHCSPGRTPEHAKKKRIINLRLRLRLVQPRSLRDLVSRRPGFTRSSPVAA